MKPELIFYGGHKLTEAPLYDKKTKTLYFVAIRYNTIFAMNTDTLAISSFTTDGPVGGFVFRGDEFIEAEKGGIYKIDFKAGTKEKIAHVLPHEKMRYNHIIADSRGRLLVDVMGDEERCVGMGGLYSIDGSSSRCIIDGMTVSNGVCLNDDETKLYFTDTPSKKVWCYDYDINTGDVSNEQVIMTFEGAPGPDGLMLDKNGLLYVTEWAGGKIDVIDTRDFRKVNELVFPCLHITASCLGEDNCMYVTTAKCGDEDEVPYAGGIFKVKLS